MRTCITILLSLCLLGCFKPAPVKLYSGPDLPTSELAVIDKQILRTSPFVTEHVRSYAIDGRSVRSKYKQTIFPPVLVREGRHQLELEVDIGDYRNSCSCSNKLISLSPPLCSYNPEAPWLNNCKYSDYKMLCNCDYKSYSCEGVFYARKGETIGIAITGGESSVNIEFEKIDAEKLITRDETNKNIKCKYIGMTRLEDLDFDDR